MATTFAGRQKNNHHHQINKNKKKARLRDTHSANIPQTFRPHSTHGRTSARFIVSGSSRSLWPIMSWNSCCTLRRSIGRCSSRTHTLGVEWYLDTKSNNPRMNEGKRTEVQQHPRQLLQPWVTSCIVMLSCVALRCGAVRCGAVQCGVHANT